MESFYPKNSNKTLNESAAKAMKRYVVCAIQSKNEQNRRRPKTSFIFHAKKNQRGLEDKVDWKQNYLN